MRKFTPALLAAVVMSSAVLPGGFAAAQSSIFTGSSKVITGNYKGVSASDVDTSRGLKLEVHKKPANPNDDPVEGEKPEGGIKGLTFTLHRAEGIDVTTDKGREDASRERTQEEIDKIKTKKVASLVTDSSGKVVFTDLEAGLYYLEETAPDNEHNYHVSSPLWILLPLGGVDGNGFEHESIIVVKPVPTTPPTTVTVPPVTYPPVTVPSVTTTPGTPVTPSTPATPPGQPGAPNETPTSTPGKSDKTRQPTLASTGANVLWAVVLGTFLVGLGFWLSRRNGRDA